MIGKCLERSCVEQSFVCVDIHTVWVEPYRPYSPTAMMTAVHRKASNNLTRKFHQILSLSIRIHGRFVSMYRARYVVSSGGCISRAYAWCFQFTFDMSAFNVMWLDFHGQPWSRLQAGSPGFHLGCLLTCLYRAVLGKKRVSWGPNILWRRYTSHPVK